MDIISLLHLDISFIENGVGADASPLSIDIALSSSDLFKSSSLFQINWGVLINWSSATFGLLRSSIDSMVASNKNISIGE